jgi:hypothetical protein
MKTTELDKCLRFGKAMVMNWDHPQPVWMLASEVYVAAKADADEHMKDLRVKLAAQDAELVRLRNDLCEIRRLAAACFIPSWRELIPARLDGLLFPVPTDDLNQDGQSELVRLREFAARMDAANEAHADLGDQGVYLVLIQALDDLDAKAKEGGT